MYLCNAERISRRRKPRVGLAQWIHRGTCHRMSTPQDSLPIRWASLPNLRPVTKRHTSVPERSTGSVLFDSPAGALYDVSKTLNMLASFIHETLMPTDTSAHLVSFWYSSIMDYRVSILSLSSIKSIDEFCYGLSVIKRNNLDIVIQEYLGSTHSWRSWRIRARSIRTTRIEQTCLVSFSNIQLLLLSWRKRARKNRLRRSPEMTSR